MKYNRDFPEKPRRAPESEPRPKQRDPRDPIVPPQPADPVVPPGREVIFGYNAVAEALRAGHPLNRIYFSLTSRRPHIQELKQLALEANVRFDFVDIGKLNVLAHTGEHQDVVAVASPVEYTELDDFLNTNHAAESLTVVVLDQVQNSGNVGMIVRTAVCAGASAVVLSARGGSLINDQVFRASAGAIFHIPIIKSMSLAKDLKTLKDAGFWIYGLEASGATDIYQERWAKRSALVIGNEHEGARPVTQKQWDLSVRIPIANDFDSLNAAIAAGIVLFQVAQYHHIQNQNVQNQHGHDQHGQGQRAQGGTSRSGQDRNG